MTATNQLKEIIMDTPWVWTLCKNSKTPEELRALVKQLMEDAPAIFSTIDQTAVSYVNWAVLKKVLNEEIQLYKIREVMDILNVVRNTIYNHINNGNLEAIKVGGEWRVSQEALEKFMARKQGGKKPDGKEKR
jgi:excisionase family DNA binding protein